VLLRELSSDFQVIYLACSNRYDALADAVVELPGPTDTEAAEAARAGGGAGGGAKAKGKAEPAGGDAGGTEPSPGEPAASEPSTAEQASREPTPEGAVAAGRPAPLPTSRRPMPPRRRN